MSSAFEKAEHLIPAEVRMISGCRDEQTSADVSNVASFSLPDPAGQAGGALTSAFLKVLYSGNHSKCLSFQELLLSIREVLKQGRFDQIPQLSSSRPLDIKHDFNIVPENFSGRRHAVMIGINYSGQQGELSGCHSDVKNMIKYIKDVHGFTDGDITIMLDDGEHESPNHDNIMSAYKTVSSNAKPGDAVFCHYSGHGGKIRDDDKDEQDGYDETLVPLDYEAKGQIRDDDVFTTLVGSMSKGVTLTCIYDCCHSGTVLDLPYHFVADGSQEEMTVPDNFNFEKLQHMASVVQSLYSQAQSGADPIALAQQAATKVCCTLL